MIKFLVFSDLHYDDAEDGDTRIDNILVNAQSRQLDFIVSLGDLCKPILPNRKVLEKFNSLGVPFYPVIGNHETDEADLSAITEFYSLNSPYYSVIYGSYKLIFLNTCYLMENGTEKAYYKRNFKHSSSVHPIVPIEEIRWLQEELKTGTKYIVFSHHSFVNEFMKRGVSNKSTMQELFRENSVLLCLNGHDHGDSFACVDGVSYMTVNSANYAWLGTQIASSKTLMEKYSYLHGMLQYAQAMSAYIEIDDHEIRIFGEEGSYLSVTPDDIELYDYKWNGVSVEPRISSHRIGLKPVE
jgi:predicted phosphodiesterase